MVVRKYMMIDRNIKIITDAEAKVKTKENRRFVLSTLTMYYNYDEYFHSCAEITYGKSGSRYIAIIDGKTTFIDQKAFEKYKQKYNLTQCTGERVDTIEMFECDGETFVVNDPRPDDGICQRCGRKSEELEKTFRDIDGVHQKRWECPDCIEE